ncbi:hypothetical protein [Paracoccus sp. Ld10]|uniref:hypothetical protein n=1 Tax=Paracoccus sp. Ld10 TaxID=649158 RepID=UPI00386CB018
MIDRHADATMEEGWLAKAGRTRLAGTPRWYQTDQAIPAWLPTVTSPGNSKVRVG